MTTGKLDGGGPPISLAWGSTGWSAAISRVSSTYRSSQDISKIMGGPDGPQPRIAYLTTEHPANGSPSQPRHALLKRENMVKPHGSLVPVSSTHRCASTPGLSTWSSTRSLQRDYSLGDLISWRVSRLDAFSVSPFRT